MVLLMAGPAVAAPLFLPVAPARCDLAVVDVTLDSPAEAPMGTTVRVTVTIRNLGTAPSQPTKAACTYVASGIIPGREAREIPVLQPGEKHVMQFAYQPGIAARYRVQASVDTALFEDLSCWRNDHLPGPVVELLTGSRTYPEAAPVEGTPTVRP